MIYKGQFQYIIVTIMISFDETDYRLLYINGIMDTYSLDRVVVSKSARAC